VDSTPATPELPREPIDRIAGPLERFLHVESASGVVLLLATGTALVLANSPAADAFLGLWKTPLTVGFGDFEMSYSLKHWINDGLMGIFFFVIGLEVKREIVLGQLRNPKRAALPLAAALGGMLVPAAIYLALEGDGPAARGWGIPMATDIAFVVGCLALLGSRVPASLRAFLLTLAIADDIGAILVIALGYSKGIAFGALGLAFLGIGLVVLMGRLGVRSIGAYVLVGGGVWLGFHESGIHPTVAGVVLGLLTPTRSWVGESTLDEYARRVRHLLQGGGWESSSARLAELRRMQRVAREATSPLERIEAALHPWVGFAIMPLFALANAGIRIEPTAFVTSVAIGVELGLVLGKPVGVFAFSWAAVRLRIAERPDDLGWGTILGGGFLAGIGFTMALFIAELALDGATREIAKTGVLAGSAIAAVLGLVILWTRQRPIDA
jgi:NhaA family Na+:H+ antiporter